MSGYLPRPSNVSHFRTVTAGAIACGTVLVAVDVATEVATEVPDMDMSSSSVSGETLRDRSPCCSSANVTAHPVANGAGGMVCVCV